MTTKITTSFEPQALNVGYHRSEFLESQQLALSDVINISFKVDMFNLCLHDNDSSLKKSPKYFVAKLRVNYFKTFSCFLKMYSRKKGHVDCYLISSMIFRIRSFLKFDI